MLHEFDSLGRRVKEIAAPSSVFGAGAPGTRDLTTQYRYDAGGRVSRRIDANRQSTWYVYDAAGQLTHTISALGEVSESKYDAVGRLVYSRRCAQSSEREHGCRLRRCCRYFRSADSHMRTISATTSCTTTTGARALR